MQRESREMKPQNKDQCEYTGAAGQEVHSRDNRQMSVPEAKGGKRGERSGMGHEHVLGLSQDQRGRGKGVCTLSFSGFPHYFQWLGTSYKSLIIREGRHNQL